jgi:hypothetical protein
VKAVDLDGVEWRVRRRWLPRYEGKGLRERNRQRKARAAKRKGDGAGHILDGLDLPDPGGDSLVAWVVLVVGVVLLFVLAVWGFVFVLALVDLIIVLLVAVVGIVARGVLRRPWTVEATAADGRRHERRVVGWRRSTAAANDLAADIVHNRLPAAPA